MYDNNTAVGQIIPILQNIGLLVGTQVLAQQLTTAIASYGIEGALINILGPYSALAVSAYLIYNNIQL